MGESQEERILIEKKFYERLANLNSEFLEVFFQLSRICLFSKKHKKALKFDKKIAELMKLDAISYYNLACDYLLIGDIEKSFKYLKIAIILGFKNKKYILKDPDLENLRKSEKFKILLKMLK
ncbi:MAG: hypothetical protein NC915_02965 [Candidatus Omnitrophica bacterium]|nr:hypothetical protein [Candidatus Omnitrophota bacterium]